MNVQLLMRAIDELKTKDNLSRTTMAVIDDLRDLVREERSIDYGTLEIDGIDYRDDPDFCDAYFSRGFYTDGTELSGGEMKAKDPLVLEMCIKDGIMRGWNRAHKYTDTPGENLIKQAIETAIDALVWEWFDMEGQ